MSTDGADVGDVDGAVVGCDDGDAVGCAVGLAEGATVEAVGTSVGTCVGDEVGPAVGTAVGADGALDGALLGVALGAVVGPQVPETQLQRVAPGTKRFCGHDVLRNDVEITATLFSFTAELGMLIVPREMQSENACESIVSTAGPTGSRTDVSWEQKLNACVWIDLTEFGMKMWDNPDSEKPKEGIVVIPLGSETVDN